MAAKLCLRFLVLTAVRSAEARDARWSEIDCTVHGFRSSFKTWTIEATTTPWAVGEAALAHVVGNSTEAAYVRGDLFEQRRELMVAWADFAAPRPRKSS